VCEKIPVPCPLECGESLPREQLVNHVIYECGLLVVDCEYKYAGCSEEVKRADMADHLRENVVQHMSRLSTHQEAEFEKLKDKNTSLEKKVATSSAELKKVTAQIDVLEVNNNALNAEVRELRVENQALRDSLAELSKTKQGAEAQATKPPEAVKTPLVVMPHPILPPVSPSLNLPADKVPPLELKMENYRKIKQGRNRWTSAPFYSLSGHKLVLSVEPYGTRDGEGTHMSSEMYIVKGEYDHKIQWPFKGDVKFSIVSQCGGMSRSTTVRFRSYKENKDVCERKMDNRLNSGLASRKFLDHTTVEAEYLFSDSLLFRIDVIRTIQ